MRVAGSQPASIGVPPTFVLYTVPADQQFVNLADNRARGVGNNPFGNFRGTGLATTDEHVGPLPGDTGLYTAHLYTSTAVKKSVGDLVFVCNYTFGKDGLCDVQFRLARGTIVGLGFYSALATKNFTLAVTGGTGAYRGMKGSIEAFHDNIIPTIAEIQVVSHTVPSLQLESQRLVFVLRRPSAEATTAASRGSHAFTLYADATAETFMDHADDETRGWIANPFGLVDRRQEYAESEDKGGPYPGDAAFITFEVYSKPTLTAGTRLGTAQFACFYYFDTNGLCESTYTIGHGTLNSVGAFPFHSTSFPLAITGGTSMYAGASGEVDVSPGRSGPPGADEQQLHFILDPA